MRQAKDYIVFPLDVSSSDEAKSYVELLADHVGLFKVGYELMIRSGPDIVRFINTAGGAGVFLDLKLHDIPATVSRAMAGIVDLDIRFATVHCGETPKMLEAAVGASQGRVQILGVTVLTSMTDQDLQELGYTESATQRVLRLAAMSAASGLDGVVCSPLEVGPLRAQRGGEFRIVEAELDRRRQEPERGAGVETALLRDDGVHLAAGPLQEAVRVFFA